jgi:hypothetical protein
MPNYNYSDPDYLQDKIEGMQLDIASLKAEVEKLTAHNTTNNAIALLIDLQEAICSNEITDPSVHDILMKRINAVVAQQH